MTDAPVLSDVARLTIFRDAFRSLDHTMFEVISRPDPYTIRFQVPSRPPRIDWVRHGQIGALTFGIWLIVFVFYVAPVLAVVNRQRRKTWTPNPIVRLHVTVYGDVKITEERRR